MKCARCCGLMVLDDLLDMRESHLPMWMRALRCVTCGNIEDPLIHYHRTVQRARKAKNLTSRSSPTMARPAQAA
jgi:hypothetical protein